MPNERHYNELNLESVGINLPYNMQAEQSVLGAVLLKPETLTDLVEIIRPEMFYTRQNAQIYSEMLRLFTSDQTIDFVTLLDAVISDGVFPSADEAKVYLTGLAETVPSNLIEIVRTAPLQRNQLFYGRKVVFRQKIVLPRDSIKYNEVKGN